MSDTSKLYLNNLPEDLEKLEIFLNEIDFKFKSVDSADNADLVIDKPDERLVSKSDMLHSGGRISCPLAFMTAGKLGISKINTGKLMTLLDIKIFGCQLGCFE